jgi:type II secretory ATPase GspE/PulE/Tfp pilus assembly ATPase PilB-like protein
MGVPNFLVASTVNLIIGQRLVRKICPSCIQSYNLTKEMITEIEKHMNIKNILETLQKEKIIADAKQGLGEMLFYRGKGCVKCKNTGYKGRIGIYETLEVTDEISNLLLRKSDLASIQEEANKQGMIYMVEDGFIKAKNGITTIEEVLRVTRE